MAKNAGGVYKIVEVVGLSKTSWEDMNARIKTMITGWAHVAAEKPCATDIRQFSPWGQAEDQSIRQAGD